MMVNRSVSSSVGKTQAQTNRTGVLFNLPGLVRLDLMGIEPPPLVKCPAKPVFVAPRGIWFFCLEADAYFAILATSVKDASTFSTHCSGVIDPFITSAIERNTSSRGVTLLPSGRAAKPNTMLSPWLYTSFML